MFEKIVLRHDDIGALAESLLFYSTVHVVLSSGQIANLTNRIGLGTTRDLLDAHRLKLSSLDKHPVVLTTNSEHRYNTVLLQGTKKGEQLSPQDRRKLSFKRALKDDTMGLRAFKQLDSHIAYIDYPDPEFKANIIDPAFCALQDYQRVNRAAKAIVEALAPGLSLPISSYFRPVIMSNDGRFRILTNIDWRAVNSVYHQRVDPKHSSVTSELLLSYLLRAHEEAYFAARYMSEMASDPATTAAFREGYALLANARISSESLIGAFQQLVVPDAPTVRETINSGARSFDEFVPLLREADKFKNWIDGQNPDANLLSRYISDVTRRTWFERLPAKSMRFAIFGGLGVAADVAGAGGVGAAAGLALGAADSFIVDKLLKGWRPNQFVAGPLDRFLRPK